MINISTAKHRQHIEEHVTARKAHIPVVRVITQVVVPTDPVPSPIPEQDIILDQKAENIIIALQDEMTTILSARRKISSSIYSLVYGRNSDMCIDIGTVLNKIDMVYDEHSNTVRTFSLRFIAAGGRTSEIINARKSVKHPHLHRKGASNADRKFKYNLKKKGTILLSCEGDHYRSVLVSSIYEFQDFKSKRWIRVRH